VSSALVKIAAVRQNRITEPVNRGAAGRNFPEETPGSTDQIFDEAGNRLDSDLIRRLRGFLTFRRLPAPAAQGHELP
jgi:hypothetical protein